MTDHAAAGPAHGHFRWTAIRYTSMALLGYFALAYLLMPFLWRRVEHRPHPALTTLPETTSTKDRIPGDPLNLALIGTEEALTRSLLAAGWFPADALSLKSSLRIAGDTVLRRPYTDAPVSSLYVWGRKQDLAYEQPVGDDPRKRHHVRFWKSTQQDDQGRPLWVGAATFDRRVGFSHTTGQITHHISPDVDLERDKLLKDLRHAGRVAEVRWIMPFHHRLFGKNGGGDPWQTDGRLAVITVQP